MRQEKQRITDVPPEREPTMSEIAGRDVFLLPVGEYRTGGFSRAVTALTDDPHQALRDAAAYLAAHPRAGDVLVKMPNREHGGKGWQGWERRQKRTRVMRDPQIGTKRTVGSVPVGHGQLYMT